MIEPMILLYPSWCRARRMFSSGESSRSDQLRYLTLAISLAVLLCGVYRGVGWFLVEMGSSPFLSTLLPDVILDLFLLSTGSISFISNLATTLGILFFADDLELILASPLSAPRFLLGRFGRVWLLCSWMPLIFAIPVISAIGIHYNAPPLFYISAAVLIPATLLLPTILAALIAIPLAHSLPRLALKGTRVLLIGCGVILVALVMYILPTVLNEANSTDRIVRLFYYLTLPDNRFLPIRWVSTILSALATNTPAPLAAYALLFGSLIGVGISLTFLLYASLYPQTYALNKTASHASETTFSIAKIVERLMRRKSAQSRAVITAELGYLIRDWTSLFEIGLLVILGSIYLSTMRISSFTGTLVGPEQIKWTQIFFSINIMLATFFGLACATRLIFPSISRDGRSAWMLYTSPITIEQIVQTKYRLWSRFLALMVAVFLGVSTYLTIGSIPITLLCCLFGAIVAHGTAAIAIGVGGEYANFSWEHLTQLSGSLGSLLCMIINLLYAGACGAMFLSCILLPRLKPSLSTPVASSLAIIVGFFAIFALTSAITRLALRRAVTFLGQDLR
jgi:hypothetical protein